MTTRSASARYEGLGKDGKGHISTQSGLLTDAQYGFNTRFEDGPGTNPERS
jgi:osmotically inducible protein OsmC